MHNAFVVRVLQSGFAVDAPPKPAMLGFYVPLIAAPLVLYSLALHPGEAFLDREIGHGWVRWGP